MMLCNRAKMMLVTNRHDLTVQLSWESNGPLPFRRNFEKIRNRQKYYYIMEEHPKLGKFAKFGCEMF